MESYWIVLIVLVSVIFIGLCLWWAFSRKPTQSARKTVSGHRFEVGAEDVSGMIIDSDGKSYRIDEHGLRHEWR